MIGDELWIDGERADMGGDSGIYLEYRSNLFTDVSKMVGNFSHTISLPKTGRNMKLIDGCIHPGVEGEFPVVSHKAVVKRNGVPIVNNASLHLMRVTEDVIEVALTWGVSERLKTLIGTKDMLSDMVALKDPNGNRYTDFPYGVTNDTRYRRWLPRIEQGLMPRDAKFMLPVAPVEDLLRGIEMKYGVKLNMGSDDHKNWAMPITSAKGDDGEVTHRHLSDRNEYQTGVYVSVPMFLKGEHGSSMPEYVSWTSRQMYGMNAYSMDTPGAEGTIGMKSEIFASIWFAWFGDAENDAQPEDVRLVIAGVKHVEGRNTEFEMDKDDIVYDVRPTSITGGNYGWLIVFDVAAEFSLTKGSAVSAFIYADGKKLHLGDAATGIKSESTMTMRAEYSTTTIELDIAAAREQFPIEGNLPKLEVVKFIKAISQMSGLFPLLGEAENEIDFVPYSEVLGGKSNAYDWSDELVTGRWWIPDMSFSVGHEGKKNVFKYKEGDAKDWDSFFVIDNASLEDEKTIVDLPFVPFRSTIGRAVIRLFDYDSNYDEDGRYFKEFKGDDKPYIIAYSNIMGESVATRIGLTWYELLGKNYTEYMDMLRNARVVKASIRLTSIVLNSLDMRRPVYLRQYASYFAIIEIKTKANDIAEVKLIKI